MFVVSYSLKHFLFQAKLDANNENQPSKDGAKDEKDF